MDSRFWDAVYTPGQIAERCQVDEADVWTWIKTHRLPIPPYCHGTNVFFLRSWVEKWIAEGRPAAPGFVEHRRAINNLMSIANGNGPFVEMIPTEYPVVAMAGDGTTITFDQEQEDE